MYYDAETDHVYCPVSYNTRASTFLYSSTELRSIFYKYVQIFKDNPHIEFIKVTHSIDFRAVAWNDDEVYMREEGWKYDGLKISSDGIIWALFRQDGCSDLLEVWFDLELEHNHE